MNRKTDTGPTSAPRWPARSATPFAFTRSVLGPRTSVIVLSGDLDLESAPTLRSALLDAVDAGADRIVVDLSGVTFMDSTGLGVLIGIRRVLGPDGQLAISCANPKLLQLFELTGFDQTFAVRPTIQAALAHVGHKQADSDQAALAGSSSDEVTITTTAASAPDPARRERHSVEAALTRDGALVVGIVATAMPFARSGSGQAERWLRALCQHGDAAVVLASLGIAENPTGTAASASTERSSARPRRTGEETVTTVIEHAQQIAAHREAATITTTDLLRAVIEVYGEDCERVLTLYGLTCSDVNRRLELSRNDPT